MKTNQAQGLWDEGNSLLAFLVRRIRSSSAPGLSVWVRGIRAWYDDVIARRQSIGNQVTLAEAEVRHAIESEAPVDAVTILRRLEKIRTLLSCCLLALVCWMILADGFEARARRGVRTARGGGRHSSGNRSGGARGTRGGSGGGGHGGRGRDEFECFLDDYQMEEAA